MKKIMLTLLVLGLVAVDASARSHRYGYRNCYERCDSGCRSCPEKVSECCPTTACKVDRIVEQACPEAPCCVKYVKVEEPALITKHVNYTWECPPGCSTDNIQAGMMHAGEKGKFVGEY